MITNTERREAHLALGLWKLGKPDVFAGVTDTHADPDVIKRRIRKAILGDHVGQNIGHMVAFVKGDKSVTLEQAFTSTYNEPLIRSTEAA